MLQLVTKERSYVWSSCIQGPRIHISDNFDFNQDSVSFILEDSVFKFYGKTAKKHKDWSYSRQKSWSREAPACHCSGAIIRSTHEQSKLSSHSQQMVQSSTTQSAPTTGKLMEHHGIISRIYCLCNKVFWASYTKFRQSWKWSNAHVTWNANIIFQSKKNRLPCKSWLLKHTWLWCE